MDYLVEFLTENRKKYFKFKVCECFRIFGRFKKIEKKVTNVLQKTLTTIIDIFLEYVKKISLIYRRVSY